MIILIFLWLYYYNTTLVSVRLIKAENLDWRLFRVSDQRLVKWNREILPYIQAQFASQVHAKFPARISCLHMTFYSLPAIPKLAFPTFVALKIPEHDPGKFSKTLKMAATHCLFVGFTILKRLKMQLSWQWVVNTILIVNNLCGQGN